MNIMYYNYNYPNYYPYYNNTNNQPQPSIKPWKIHLWVFGIMLIAILLSIGMIVKDDNAYKTSVAHDLTVRSQNNHSAIKRHLDNYERIDENLCHKYNLSNVLFSSLRYDNYKQQYIMTISPSIAPQKDILTGKIPRQHHLSVSQKNIAIIFTAIKIQQRLISKETNGRNKGIIIRPYLPTKIEKKVNANMRDKKVISILSNELYQHRNDRVNKIV